MAYGTKHMACASFACRRFSEARPLDFADTVRRPAISRKRRLIRGAGQHANHAFAVLVRNPIFGSMLRQLAQGPGASHKRNAETRRCTTRTAWPHELDQQGIVLPFCLGELVIERRINCHVPKRESGDVMGQRLQLDPMLRRSSATTP
jgi:hypothetical protein